VALHTTRAWWLDEAVLAELTGVRHHVYPQQLLVADLIEELRAAGGEVAFARAAAAIRIAERPVIVLADGDEVSCDFVLGCDGFHGASRLDLSAYAGESVEISIAYASDWSVQGIGVFVDDITLPDGTGTSFETGLDGWAIAGSPEGSAPNINNFIRTDASGFRVGNAISTPHSLLLGFGLEGVSTEAELNAVMGRALDHLLE
jgi:FAD binding domain